jgi:hypothetical protein
MLSEAMVPPRPNGIDTGCSVARIVPALCDPDV